MCKGLSKPKLKKKHIWKIITTCVQEFLDICIVQEYSFGIRKIKQYTKSETVINAKFWQAWWNNSTIKGWVIDTSTLTVKW